MKTLVTGADGLLGSNVVRELLNRSKDVRVFLQPGRALDTLDGLDIEYAYGDILDIDDVEHAVDGCSKIIHCAALTTPWPARNPACMRVNIQGTRHIVQAALKHAIDRLVHVSSAGVFAPGSFNHPGTEANIRTDKEVVLDYIRSKIFGQRLVLDATHRTNLPAIVVNPTFMIGPYDTGPSSGKMILAYLHNKLPGYTSGGKNFVHVQDASYAICNALTMGRNGECYILGNENLSYKNFLDKVSDLSGRPPLARKIGDPFVKLFGMGSSVISSLTRNPPTVSYPMARLSCINQYFSPEKARTELNLPHHPIEHAIADAIRWFDAHGYLNIDVSHKHIERRLAKLSNSVKST